MYSVAFDGAGSWNFGNDFARNVVIFGVDNSWSFDTDNREKNFLVLGEGPTYGITGIFGSPEKKLSINFTQRNTKIFFELTWQSW